MLRGVATSGAERSTYDERHFYVPSEHIPHLGRHVHDLIHGKGYPVGIENFDDWPQAHGRRPYSQPGERGLGDRSIDHSFRTKYIEQPLRHPEGVPADCHVTAHENDGFVT